MASIGAASAMRLLIGSSSFSCGEDDYTHVTVPHGATIDDVIAKLQLEGCCGFFAVTKRSNEAMYYGDEDEEDAGTKVADGGVLLSLGRTLASYGVDAMSCKALLLFGVFSDKDKQPTVYRADLEKLGLGESVYKYVKLQSEDKELLLARRYFSSPVLRWLASTTAEQPDGVQQTVEFGMTQEMSADMSRSVLTVCLARDGDTMSATCTNLAGDIVLSVEISVSDSIATLQNYLCEKLQWASLVLWNGSDEVLESDVVSNYSLLTAGQSGGLGHVCGCYQYHTTDVHPAGYSASGTTRADYLVLEPGKAGLQTYFKGDYKRAEELRKLTMMDAQWYIETLGDGRDVVRIIGQAILDRYFVHERSGYDGGEISNYTCYCLVSIPVQQLLAAQSEQHCYSSTEGSGWTCGSEDYKCTFYLPMPVLRALRVQRGRGREVFGLQSVLNGDASLEYPYNKMTLGGHRFGNHLVCQLDKHTVEVLAHLRENLKGNPDATMEEILQLQDSAPAVATAGNQ